MAGDDLYLECFRRSMESWRRGLFDRPDTVAIMAWAIDIDQISSPLPKMFALPTFTLPWIAGAVTVCCQERYSDQH